MKFTKSADSALRTLTHLAISDDSESMPKLAKSLSIPYNNLIKIVQKLNKAGLVETKQGKQGGVKLKREAHAITVLDTIEAIEGPTILTKCQDLSKDCGLEDCCTVKDTFSKLQEKIDNLLAEVSLGDILENRGKK